MKKQILRLSILLFVVLIVWKLASVQKKVDQSFIRSVNTDNQALVSFVLNSVSTNKVIVTPQLKEGRVTFDLRDYNISAETWDKLFPTPPDLPTFVGKVLGNGYYPILGIKNQNDAEKIAGLLDQIDDLTQRIQRVRPVNSVVTPNWRHVRMQPTVNGWLWSTYDVTDLNDVFINITNGDKLYQEISLAGSLPNGLAFYYHGDAKGNPLDMIDPKVAIDNLGENKLMRVAISCVRCHGKGFVDIDGEMASKDPLVEMFGQDMGKHLRVSQQKHTASVRLATGLEPVEVINLLCKEVD